MIRSIGIASILFLCCGAAAQVRVTGMVADEASKAAVLAQARALYGTERVQDQLTVGVVSAPANWDGHVRQLLGAHMKLLTRGQLTIDGTVVHLRGEVASEAERQRLTAAIAASLNPTYSVRTELVVAASAQATLDAVLADRIVEFESGKATLTEDGKRILDQMSAALARLRGRKVSIVGHTDNLGARSANLALSLARADAVKVYVAAQGIAPETMTTAGLGPDRPLADNRSAQGRTRNRRIEFRLAPSG